MRSSKSEAGLRAGDRHYKAFVGSIEDYDVMGALQFALLTALGLQQHHTLLDIGCGSLRAGKLFIPYLQAGRYFGIEPEQWLIDQGIEHELGHDCVRIKRPRFDNNAAFELGVFGAQFDYILAQSVFSHATQPQIRGCLAAAAEVMKPTSVFVATFVAGEEDYDGGVWVYPERVTYKVESIAEMAREAGLTYVPIRWSHPTGQTWFAAVKAGNEQLIAELSEDPIALPLLRHRLRETESRLQRILQSPVVRLGVWLRRLLVRARL